MKIRTLLTLVVIFCIFSCKKDKGPRHISGLVLHIKDNTPVADASVQLFQAGTNVRLVYAYTNTNAQGKFDVTLEGEKARVPYFGISIARNGLVQCPGFGLAVNNRDTLYMDDVSYLRVVVTTTKPPAQEAFHNVVCRFTTADDAPTDQLTWLGNPAGYIIVKTYNSTVASDTLSIPFSYRTYHKATIVLTNTSLSPFVDTLAQANVVLQPYTTTETHLVY